MQEAGQTNLLTVRPQSQAQPQKTFLHAFYLSPAKEAFVPADLRLVETSTHLGAALTDRYGNRWEILFPREHVGEPVVRKLGDD